MLNKIMVEEEEKAHLWVCESCGFELRDNEMDYDFANPQCKCGNALVFAVTKATDRPRKIQAIFDYSFQAWRDPNTLSVIEEQDSWDFPCNKCSGPATLRSVNCYYELHECLECHTNIKVK